MGKTYNRFTVPKAASRNPFALPAKMRRANYMKHRNAARGGARNDQHELLDECESEMDEYLDLDY